MPSEPSGRPKTLVRRHILEVKEDTREWVDDLVDSVVNKVVITKGVVQPVSAFLGNPSVGNWLVGVIALGVAAVAVKEGTVPAENAAKGFVCSLGLTAGLSQEDCNALWGDALRYARELPVLGGLFGFLRGGP